MSVKLSLTCTTIFLVPHLGIDRETLLKKEIGFQNGYWKDLQADNQYEGTIILLFQPTQLTLFSEFIEKERERTESLIDDYDYDGGFTVLVYALPKGFEEDIRKFKRGKYSQFSEKFRSVYPETVLIKDKFGDSKEEQGLAWRIIHKSSDIKEFWEKELGVFFGKDDEIWQKPLMDKETLDIGVSPMRELS